MEEMFKDAQSSNQLLDKWNVSNVTDMRDMFVHTESFNQPLHAPQAWYHHYSSEDEDEDYWSSRVGIGMTDYVSRV